MSRKILSFMLVLALLISVSAPAFAAETTTETVVYDGVAYTITTGRDYRTVVDESSGVCITFNMLDKVLAVESDNPDECITVDIGAAIESSMVSPADSNSSDDNEYAYDTSIVTHNGKQYNFWEIQIPGQIKMTYANVNNVTYLNSFRSNVDTMRDAEDHISTGWGRTILVTILAAIAGAGVGAVAGIILAVVGNLVGSDSIPDLIDYSKTVKQCQKNCESAFSSVIVYSTPSM